LNLYVVLKSWQFRLLLAFRLTGHHRTDKATTSVVETNAKGEEGQAGSGKKEPSQNAPPGKPISRLQSKQFCAGLVVMHN